MRPLRKRMRPLLGTYVEIGANASGVDADRAITAAFAVVEQVQKLMSFQDSASELSSLNRQPGQEVALHPWTIRVLHLARSMTRDAAPYFNCMVGGALVRSGVLPDAGGPEPLGRGSAEDLLIAGRIASLRRPVRITLDGIAKGFAVDRAVLTLMRRGIRGGWVNAGGDLRVFGDLSLPVHQRTHQGDLLPLGDLRNGALATSSTGTKDAKRSPGCILARDGCSPRPATVSVLARLAWRADALTKVAALAPTRQATDLISRLGGRLCLPEREWAI